MGVSRVQPSDSPKPFEGHPKTTRMPSSRTFCGTRRWFVQCPARLPTGIQWPRRRRPARLGQGKLEWGVPEDGGQGLVDPVHLRDASLKQPCICEGFDAARCLVAHGRITEVSRSKARPCQRMSTKSTTARSPRVSQSSSSSDKLPKHANPALRVEAPPVGCWSITTMFQLGCFRCNYAHPIPTSPAPTTTASTSRNQVSLPDAETSACSGSFWLENAIFGLSAMMQTYMKELSDLGPVGSLFGGLGKRWLLIAGCWMLTMASMWGQNASLEVMGSLEHEESKSTLVNATVRVLQAGEPFDQVEVDAMEGTSWICPTRRLHARV